MTKKEMIEMNKTYLYKLIDEFRSKNNSFGKYYGLTRFVDGVKLLTLTELSKEPPEVVKNYEYAGECCNARGGLGSLFKPKNTLMEFCNDKDV